MKCPLCGKKVDIKKESIQYEFEGRMITIHNVPHFYCNTCSNEFLPEQSKKNLERLLGSWFGTHKGYEVDFAAMENDEAASIAASSGIMF